MRRPDTRTTDTARIRGAGARRRRARSAVLTVLTALTLVTATVGTSQAQQATDGAKARTAEATARTAGATARTAGAKAKPAAQPRTETSPLRDNSGTRCEPTKPGSKERRAGATEACVSTSPAPAQPQNRAGLTAAPVASCTITNPGTYSYERFSYCVTGINVVYVLRDSQGAELGRGTLQVSTSATLPKAATAWEEQVTVKMTAASGEVTALDAKVRASCTTGCTATRTAPWYVSDLVVGKTLTGPVTYSSTPAQGAAAEFTTGYKMYVTAPGTTVVDPNASWDNPRKLRCDNAVGGSAPAGCVVPSVTPVVPMSANASQPGGAVAAYQWAQKNLDDAWGKGKPLTRSTSGVADRTAQTCAGFTPETELVDNDTCGDFPFGEAKEGGSAGTQCVEVIPNLGNGEWDTYVLGDSTELDRTRPCVRTHVTPADKQFADEQLTEGFADQRVIDADTFELTFTTPDTGPHAACLDTTPTGSRPNGDGWILTTAEAVEHVNKTTSPLGRAGKRPTKAQACLGRATTEGSEAQGNIVGWQDAQLYMQANSPGTQLARCHLIANILGGRGIRTNLVPCWQVGMNTGTPSMRTFESLAQNLIQGPEAAFGADDAIFYQVVPVYKDVTSTIPVGVTMNASIERADGTTEELFPNVYVPNTKENTGTLNLGN